MCLEHSHVLGAEAVALLAQWLERAAVNRKVTGSIPVGSVFTISFPFLDDYRKTPRPGIEPGSSA